MKAYRYDNEGYLIGELQMQPSPLEPGVYLLPAMSTEIQPPAPTQTTEPKWDGSAWQLVESRAEIVRKEAEQKALAEAEELRIELEKAAQEKAILDAKKAVIEPIKAKVKAKVKLTDAEVADLFDYILFRLDGV